MWPNGYRRQLGRLERVFAAATGNTVSQKEIKLKDVIIQLVGIFIYCCVLRMERDPIAA
jgi:hypothetical protein